MGEGRCKLQALGAQGGDGALGGGRAQRSLVGAQSVVGLLLQHIAEALDLGEQVLRIGLQRPLGLGLGLGLLLASVRQGARGRRRRRRVDGRIVGFLGILRRHDARVYGRSVLAPMIYRERCGDATAGRTRDSAREWERWEQPRAVPANARS